MNYSKHLISERMTLIEFKAFALQFSFTFSQKYFTWWTKSFRRILIIFSNRSHPCIPSNSLIRIINQRWMSKFISYVLISVTMIKYYEFTHPLCYFKKYHNVESYCWCKLFFTLSVPNYIKYIKMLHIFLVP